MGKIIIVGAGVLFVLGIITVSQYIDVCVWAIVGAIRSYIFWVTVGSLITVSLVFLKLFGFRG